MAIGKQIRRYRELLGWKQLQLSIASGVEVGTISALELRDSKRSDAFLPIAKAFGLTLEQLADESRFYPTNITQQSISTNVARDVLATHPVKANQLDGAIHLLRQLQPEKLPETISFIRWQLATQAPHSDGHRLPVAA